MDMSASTRQTVLEKQERDALRLLMLGEAEDAKSRLVEQLFLRSPAVSKELPPSSEQSTTDSFCRVFATGKRKFVVADAQGPAQYARMLATGLNYNLAVILIDADKDILPQTRRHIHTAALLGIRHVVLVANKTDLADFSQRLFENIVADVPDLARQFDFASQTLIPVSAQSGDNVVGRGARMSWYHGPSLLEHLEGVETDTGLAKAPFRFAVQGVGQTGIESREFAGTVTSGVIKCGDPVAVALSGRPTTVARIVSAKGDRTEATAGDAVTLILADAVEVSPGDVLCDPKARPEVSDQFAAHLLWLAEEELLPGRQYILQRGTATVSATISALKHKVDLDTLGHLAAKTLVLSDFGYCNFSLSQPLAFDSRRVSRDMSHFVLIDRFTNAVVGAGIIDFGLRRATNVHWQALDVNRATRARLKGQSPAILWFTGLPSSGKSTIANLVEKALVAEGRHTYLLDGDNIRHGLNRDLGFTDVDRVENIRRIAETAKLFVDAGLIVLTSFISPFRSERRMARDLVGAGEFVEIFVDAPLEVCMARDPKGLYEKARTGAIRNFTGIDSPYEPPEKPELTIRTVEAPPQEQAQAILRYLRDGGYI